MISYVALQEPCGAVICGGSVQPPQGRRPPGPGPGQHEHVAWKERLQLVAVPILQNLFRFLQCFLKEREELDARIPQVAKGLP